MTRERQLILDVLAEATEPLSAEDVCRKVQERLKTVALSTVYRNLKELIRREGRRTAGCGYKRPHAV